MSARAGLSRRCRWSRSGRYFQVKRLAPVGGRTVDPAVKPGGGAENMAEAYLAANPQDMEVLYFQGQARRVNGERQAADDFELARQ